MITLHKDGINNRQIGRLLGISRNTVNSYIKQMQVSDHTFDCYRK
ncbi:MAG: helix-turn-helix domain-containing protein [Bacteroidales bacterium]|nr:helix-turn-helix domain-containing protein [Bacteroidales bacterium]